MSYASQACLIGIVAAQHFPDFDLTQFTSTYKVIIINIIIVINYEGDNKNM